jgi:hypothetical protein
MLFHDVAMKAWTLINAQNTRDAAHNASDGAADDRAYRSGGSLAFPRATFNSARNPLRLRHRRHRGDGEKRGNSDQTTIHESLLCEEPVHSNECEAIRSDAIDDATVPCTRRIQGTKPQDDGGT